MTLKLGQSRFYDDHNISYELSSNVENIIDSYIINVKCYKWVIFWQKKVIHTLIFIIYY